MIQNIADCFRGRDYNGFRFVDVIRNSLEDSYHFTFRNEDKYFQLTVTHSIILNMKPFDVIQYIENMLKSHPDLQKASHHQEFYKKFDEVLK